MTLGILEIDHLLTYVQDLGHAAQTYERLGFSLTPVSHITSMGIVNRLVLLHARTPRTANFIELMGVADADRLPPPMRDLLSGEAGIKSMVMTTLDAAAAHHALSDAGYPFGPPIHVKREWVLPGEDSVWPEFDVLLPIPAPLSFNLCQYHNIRLYQREDWQRHRNTAVSLLAAFAVTAEPRARVGYFERLFEGSARPTADGGLAVTPSAIDLILYAPEHFGACFGSPPALATDEDVRYAGLRVGVADLAVLKQCLREGGLPFADERARAVVTAAEACGNTIEFVEMP